MDAAVGQPMFDQADSLESLVYQAVGAASACWEHLEGAGVFDDQQAKRVASALLDALPRFLPGSAEMARVDPEAFGLGPSAADDARSPRLGYATTAHLLNELQARIDTDRVTVGIGEPGYGRLSGALQALTDARNALTGEELAYRTVGLL